MEALFRAVGIYSSIGQLYEPVDMDTLLYYKEMKEGQILEEGITEAGSISSFIAAGSAYATHGINTIPFFIYYSMFGFQRVGDLIWAAADQRARGFLLGATAGRTTLGGEGLQHQDGTSQLVAATIPNCRAYDPAFAGELAVILDRGAREMMEEQRDVFYYVTVMNENYAQPSLPTEAHGDVLKGLYRFGGHQPKKAQAKVRLLGSGAIFREVVAAAELLAQDWNVEAELFSATSFSELARDAAAVQRQNRLRPSTQSRKSHVETLLAGDEPIVAATDYVRSYPQLIAPYLRARYVTLGTDGFGRSDTRAALRRFFEVDRHSVVIAALHALVEDGRIARPVVDEAIQRYDVATDAAASWTV
ncbi:MAG: transketolase-like TK C-terminal-containing protein, partial [Panacagrimonas sp.]